MPALLSLAVILLIGVSGVLPLAAQAPGSTTIAGGGLPHTLRLAPIDHEAFMRRLDLPPLLSTAPAPGNVSYTVTSSYWDVGVRAGDLSQPRVDDVATYYPAGGFVKTRQGSRDVWTALNMAQKAILDRYIRHAGTFGEAPSVFEVLRAAGLDGEAIGISVGPLEMTPDQRARFWQEARALQPRTVPVPLMPEPLDLSSPNPNLIWIIFNLPEGRAVPMLYSNVSGTFSEPSEGRQGTVFPVARDWLVPVLGEQARSNPAGNPLAPLAVPQEDIQGSPIWWVITIGGGTLAIAAAVLLQRRLRSAADKEPSGR